MMFKGFLRLHGSKVKVIHGPTIMAKNAREGKSSLVQDKPFKEMT